MISSETIMRCEYCRAVVLQSHIAEAGGCKMCGSRRMRIAFSLTDEEMRQAQAEGYVPQAGQWSDKPMVVDAA